MELPHAVPVVVRPGATLFPQALFPLYLCKPRDRHMLRDALKAHRMFSLAMQKPGRTRETPCLIAGLGLIRASVRHADGSSHVILQGLTRVQLGAAIQSRPYRVHPIRALQPQPNDSVVVDALLAKVHELAEERVRQGSFAFPTPSLPAPPRPQAKPGAPTAPQLNAGDILNYFQKLPDPDLVADLITCALLPNATERQTILETVEVRARLKRLIQFLLAEIRRSKNH